MKEYDLIPKHLKLLKTKQHRFELCKELCKLKTAELLELMKKWTYVTNIV